MYQDVADFGSPEAEYAAAHSGAAVFDRSAVSKVDVAGPEAAFFLHNLCTHDIRALAVGAGCESFLATNKAKAVAHVAVSRRSAELFWLDAAPAQAERILAHLNHYLISEQVELADRTSERALLRVVGPAAADVLGQALGTSVPPCAPWHHAAVSLGPDEVVVRYQQILAVPGFDCFGAASVAAGLWQRLCDAGAIPAGSQTHEVLRVEAGFPLPGQDFDENRFVVEVGRTDAISYSKGCYLGQEPIVMARDRGQVNRTLLGIRAGPGALLAAGTKLLHAGAEVGQVTSSVYSPRLKQVIALAYIRRGCQAPGTELVVSGQDRPAVVASLPFAAT